MRRPKPDNCMREYDFALIASGVPALTEKVENALFEAGCDDATLSIRYGLLYLEFSRQARSLEVAILSSISDVRKAKVGAEVLRVDECNLVTAAEIARRIGRSRQLVFQYINGQRGPGGFPPPECHLTEQTWDQQIPLPAADAADPFDFRIGDGSIHDDPPMGGARRESVARVALANKGEMIMFEVDMHFTQKIELDEVTEGGCGRWLL